MLFKRLTAYVGLIAILFTVTVPAMAYNDYTAEADRIIVKYVDGSIDDIEVPYGVNAEDFAKEYSAQSNVQYAELDSLVTSSGTPNDPYYLTYQSSVFNAMSIPQVWDITSGSSSVVVAVVDSGVDASHVDLQGRVLSGGYDFVNNDSDPNDETGGSA
jgi:subtilisin family serine protease